MINLEYLEILRKSLIQQFGVPVKRIEFNSKDYDKIKNIFRQLFSDNLIKEYNLNTEKINNNFRYIGIDLISNDDVQENYMKVIYADEDFKKEVKMSGNICRICKRELNTKDPTTKDCGGDCLRCMAEIGEDPDCIKEMRKIQKKAHDE